LWLTLARMVAGTLCQFWSVCVQPVKSNRCSRYGSVGIDAHTNDPRPVSVSTSVCPGVVATITPTGWTVG
jgi:hypothetical protein